MAAIKPAMLEMMIEGFRSWSGTEITQLDFSSDLLSWVLKFRSRWSTEQNHSLVSPRRNYFEPRDVFPLKI